MAVYDTVSDVVRAIAHCKKYLPIDPTQHTKGICLVKDLQVIAACLYENCNGSNVWMHCCGTPGTRWLNRDFLHWSFHYPFEQLKVKRVSLWVNADNLASRRFVEHLGFETEATLQGAGTGGADAIIYRMFREQCRYV